MGEGKLQIVQRIASRDPVVGVMGLGYVGLPLALTFAEAGIRVLGFDIDETKSRSLTRGRSYIKHIADDRIASAIGRGQFQPGRAFDSLAACDAVLICLPTPLGPHREPDNSYIFAGIREIATRLRRGQLVVLESTTYPGATDDEVLPLLEASGLRCPDDFLLAFSPEREDPGNTAYTTRSIPKVVGGVNAESTDAATALYALCMNRVVPVSSAKVAESCKLLENVYRSVNIALINELKMVFDKMGIDVWEVIEAAQTKPFGFSAFYPGPGLGGHCVAIDPFYLCWKAAKMGAQTRFIRLAAEINDSMPEYVVDKVTGALRSDGKEILGARLLVLGLTYKADIDDDRESPAYAVIEALQKRGADVHVCEPNRLRSPAARCRTLALSFVPVSADAFGSFDAVVITTSHVEFKDAELYRSVRIVVDARNTLANRSSLGETRWVRA